MKNFRLHISLIALLILIVTSCKMNKNTELKKLVKEWQGKEIVFPEKSIFTKYGKDTIDFSIPKSKYKILLYADSIGCTSCKLHLYKWMLFSKYIDSVANKKVSFLFYLQPKREGVRELGYLLRRDRIDFPVCIDLENRLNKLNKFSKNPMFRCFLLDSNNRVITIGNPIENLSIKKMYLSMIK